MAEVITFAAGNTAHLISSYHIHVTPHERGTIEQIAQFNTRFFAFRGKEGGKIKKLFKREVIAVILLNPTDGIERQLLEQQIELANEWIKRITRFIEGLRNLRPGLQEQYRQKQYFHLLSFVENLLHTPKPAVNPERPLCYTLEQVRTLRILPSGSCT